jgi:5-methylcytosine-specific restriction endonuclease McrA
MAKRRSISKAMRFAIYEAADGRCHICGEVIDLATEKMEVEHQVPFALGGKEDLTNLKPAHVHCHAVKTKQDVTRIAKAKRVAKKHNGEYRQTRHIVAGSKASKFRKSLNGKVTLRQTGETISEPRTPRSKP